MNKLFNIDNWEGCILKLDLHELLIKNVFNLQKTLVQAIPSPWNDTTDITTSKRNNWNALVYYVKH